LQERLSLDVMLSLTNDLQLKRIKELATLVFAKLES
jgi:hypothetical protein